MRAVRATLLASCLAALPLAGDELRLSYVLGEEELDFEPRGADGSDEWDDNERWELGAYSNLGTIWGFGIGTQRAEASHDDWSLDYESWYARIYSGMSPVMTESVTWEIVGYTGLLLGEAELERSAPGFDGGSDRDVGFEFGAQTSVSLYLTRLFFVGGGAGYGWTQLELDLDGDRRVDQQGLHYFGYAGFRF